MRPKGVMRRVRARHVVLGASAMALPGSAVALAAGLPQHAAAKSGGASPLSTSAPQGLASASHFDVPVRSFAALGNQPAHVRGRLLPALSGRVVSLVGRSGHGWRSLATGHTGRRGGFDLRFNPGGAPHQQLRVRFAGDRLGSGASAYAGSITAFQQSVASWYDDAGGTACGFHAHYGVANRTLPCGTKVSFRYGGKAVTGVVDDRGPFVSGRDWDLNQNTASALGVGGVDTVWSSQ